MSICLFQESINSYLCESSVIRYCKNCNEPHLCMSCLTSIGEASLVKLLSRYYSFKEKKRSKSFHPLLSLEEEKLV